MSTYTFDNFASIDEILYAKAIIDSATNSEYDEAFKKIGFDFSKTPRALWKEISGNVFEYGIASLLDAKGVQVERLGVSNNIPGDILFPSGIAEMKTFFKKSRNGWDAKTPKVALEWSRGENDSLDIPTLLIEKSDTEIKPLVTEVLPLWGALGPGRTYPMSVQRKNKQLNSLRPRWSQEPI